MAITLQSIPNMCVGKQRYGCQMLGQIVLAGLQIIYFWRGNGLCVLHGMEIVLWQLMSDTEGGS